jgi:hypothetical protein
MKTELIEPLTEAQQEAVNAGGGLGCAAGGGLVALGIFTGQLELVLGGLIAIDAAC